MSFQEVTSQVGPTGAGGLCQIKRNLQSPLWLHRLLLMALQQLALSPRGGQKTFSQAPSCFLRRQDVQPARSPGSSPWSHGSLGACTADGNELEEGRGTKGGEKGRRGRSWRPRAAHPSPRAAPALPEPGGRERRTWAPGASPARLPSEHLGISVQGLQNGYKI